MHGCLLEFVRLSEVRLSSVLSHLNSHITLSYLIDHFEESADKTFRYENKTFNICDTCEPFEAGPSALRVYKTCIDAEP